MDAQPTRQLARPALPGVLRWAQISLFVLFLADVYVYSILDALLGRYLGTLGISQEHMSVAYAIYGMFQIVTSIAILLMQGWHRCKQSSIGKQFGVILAVVAAAAGSTVIMIIWPASYAMLLLARGAQGTCGAVYSILSMILLARSFPAEWQMQAIAFMTAGIALQTNHIC
jgi:MFS family permease